MARSVKSLLERWGTPGDEKALLLAKLFRAVFKKKLKRVRRLLPRFERSGSDLSRSVPPRGETVREYGFSCMPASPNDECSHLKSWTGGYYRCFTRLCARARRPLSNCSLRKGRM